jgi:hypothetical protein
MKPAVLPLDAEGLVLSSIVGCGEEVDVRHAV